MFGRSLYWRDTFRNPRFFVMDGRIAILILIFILHITLWTFLLVAVTAGVLWHFERKGVGPDDILRFIRAGIVGRRRTARGLAAERSAVDYSFETDAHVAAFAARIEARAAAHEANAKKMQAAAAKQATKKQPAKGTSR